MIGRRRFILSAALALVGCSDALTKPYPERRFYTLEARRPNPRARRNRGPVLLVRRFKAGPGYEEAGLMTRLEPLTLRQDFYNQFFVPPATLIEEAVRHWMGDSGLFREVVQLGSHLDPTHALEGALTALFGDFAGPVPLAVIELQVLVLDVRRAEPDIVLRGDYRKATPLTAGTPDQLVTGWSRGLTEILTEMETALAPRLRDGAA